MAILVFNVCNEMQSKPITLMVKIAVSLSSVGTVLFSVYQVDINLIVINLMFSPT